MKSSLKEKNATWASIEKWILSVFSIVILSAFSLSFTDYVFGDISISFKLLMFYTALLMVPFSLTSLIILLTSIVNPKWFYINFYFKYWHAIFVAQVLTWLIIYNN